MGCGCKGTQTKPATESTTTTQQVQPQSSVVKEDVKSSIKKTIEKYYTVNKTTNGWVK